MSEIVAPLTRTSRRMQEGPEDGAALAVSGGGYRAMVFHLGAFLRLYELGILQTLKRVSSVSGGSITAAKVGLEWPKLRTRDDFMTHVVEPVRRLVRKRQLIASYRAPPGDANHRTGADWGIRTDIANYQQADAIPAPHARTLELAETPTRLKRMSAELQERLVNWGHAACDAAVRKHWPPEGAGKPDLPYPGTGI